MKDEALKLALEVLESERDKYLDWGDEDGAPEDVYEAITAIKQALAAQPAPVQEPIYQMQMMDGKWIDQAKQSYEYNKAHGHTVRIVYTTSPAQEFTCSTGLCHYKAVPDAMTSADIQEHIEYVAGWNDYRAAMMEMMK